MTERGRIASRAVYDPWRTGARVVWCAAMGIVACSSSNDAGTSVTVVDSAGVAVVTHASLPALDDPSYRWDVRIARSMPTDRGPTEPPRLYRPEAMMRLDDGTIVVDDRADWRIAVIDAHSDTIVNRFARSGGGPGEILGYAMLWPETGNRFSVLDHGAGRISTFGIDGRLESERPFRLPGVNSVALRNGSDFVFASRFYSSNDPGIFLVDSLGIVDLDSPSFNAIMPLWRAPNGPDGTPSAAMLFNPRVLWVPVSSGVIVGRSDTEDFEVWSAAGELERVVHVPLTPMEIPESDVREILEEAGALPGAAAAMPERPRINSHYNVTNFYWPFDDSTVAMYHSRRTLAAEDPPIPKEQTVWRIFTQTGRYRGSVWFPPRFNPQWVGGNRVLGVGADSTGAEYVQELELTPARRDRAER